MRREEVRRDSDGGYSIVIFEEYFVVKADHLLKGKGQTGQSTALALAIRDGCEGYPYKMTSFTSHTQIQWTYGGEQLLYTHNDKLAAWIAQADQPRIRVRLDHSTHRLELVHVFANKPADAEPTEPIEDNGIRRCDCCGTESGDWIECRDFPLVEYLCSDCVEV